MKHFHYALLLAVCSVSVAFAADAAYFGKWKLNPAKSQPVTARVSVEKTPSGDYRWDTDGFAYYFRPDGKEYPLPDGGTTLWKSLGANAWSCANRRNGKISTEYKVTLTGEVLTIVGTSPQTNGKDITRTNVMKRMSGGPGLPGMWESKISPPVATLEISPFGPDGLTMKYPEYKSETSGKFDGKPYPSTGTADGPKSKTIFRKTGPNSFETTNFIVSQISSVDNISVSTDGKTLTDEYTPPSRKESSRAVFDRQ